MARVNRLGTVIALVALLLVAALQPAAAQTWAGTTYDAIVTRVMDGDTIQVSIGGQLETVRYIGVTTPDIQHPTRGPQPYGEAARRANEALVAGQPVRLVLDVQPRDRYGRLLAYVWLGQQFINAELVRQGYAETATYPPNVRHRALFVEFQRQARMARVGLWGDPEATAAYRPRASGVVGVRYLKVYLHPADPRLTQRDPSDYVYFESAAEARAAGYTYSMDYEKHARNEREALAGTSVGYSPTVFPSESGSSTAAGGTPTPSYSDRGKPAPGDDVNVHGYTRRDGTVVVPHTRSAPGRQPR